MPEAPFVRPVPAGLLRCIGAALCLLFGIVCNCQAGPGDEPFYYQLLHFKDHDGYQPTRSFTIITDAGHDNRLVVADDPNLRFNQLWLERYRPGYRTHSGGAAFGEILRGYVRSLYQSYLANHGDASLDTRHGNGSISIGYIDNTDYDLRVSGSEFRVGFSYAY